MTVMDINMFNLDFADSVEAFRSGIIDAFFCVDGPPTTAITELAATHSIVLLEIDDEHANKLIETYPYYSRYEIEGGIYRGIEGSVRTVAIESVLIASDTMSEDLVYEITKTLFECRNEIATLHDKGICLEPSYAIEGFTVPIHSGAERFYIEISVLGAMHVE